MALPLALFAGASVLQGAQGYFQAKNNYELAERQNREARIAGDREQAINTVNINIAKEQALASQISIDNRSMHARSQSIVAAAAAGTAGMSVYDSILDIERNASRAEFNTQQQLHSTIFGLEENRRSIEANVRSRSILTSKPNAALAMFNTALDVGTSTYGKTWG